MISILEKIRKSYRLKYTAVAILAVIMYIVLATNKKIWADEAYTFAIIKHSYKEIWMITAADVHPPLYYVMLKAFIQPFQNSLLMARLFSVIPYIIILIVGGYEVRKLFDEKIALTFATLFILFPFILNYAAEVRMYSWAALFVFVSCIFAYRCYIFNEIKDWYIFIGAGVAAAYTHYYALVSVGIIYIVLLFFVLHQQILIKKYLKAVVLTIILYTPWFYYFIQQLIFKVNNEYWIGPITFKVIIEYIKSIFGTEAVNMSVLFATLFYTIAFILTLTGGEKKEKILSLCLLSIPIGTMGIGVLVSILIRPVFVIRYILPAMPLLILFMAISVGTMKNNIIIAIICTFFITEGIGHYAYTVEKNNTRIDNTLDSEFLSKYKECDSYAVITSSEGLTDHISYVLGYYETEKPIYINREKLTLNPFDNHIEIELLDTKKHECTMLLLELGEELPDKYREIYDCNYVDTVYENGHLAEAYILR